MPSHFLRPLGRGELRRRTELANHFKVMGFKWGFIMGFVTAGSIAAVVNVVVAVMP